MIDKSPSPDRLSDPDLVRASAGGDTTAFRVLFDRHVARVHGYVARRMGPHSVDDVVSDTFAEAWRCLDRYDPSRGSVDAWLLGIATMSIRHCRHKELRWVAAVERSIAVSEVAAPEVKVEPDPGLLVALSRLGSTDRDLLMLVAIADMAIGDAGRALGLSPTAARIRLHRARRRLQNELGNPERNSQ